MRTRDVIQTALAGKLIDEDGKRCDVRLLGCQHNHRMTRLIL